MQSEKESLQFARQGGLWMGARAASELFSSPVLAVWTQEPFEFSVCVHDIAIKCQARIKNKRMERVRANCTLPFFIIRSLALSLSRALSLALALARSDPLRPLVSTRRLCGAQLFFEAIGRCCFFYYFLTH